MLACRLLIAVALVPPWQQPDEASHVALAELQRSRVLLMDGAPDPAREREILGSMARYDFWEHRDRNFQTPAVIPERFRFAGLRVVAEVLGVDNPPTYFLAVGRLLSWLPQMTVVEDLYLMRGISAILGILTLCVGWLAARECLGALGAATIAAILALHPQFAIVSTAAAPDAMANLLGACLWWQATVAFGRKHFLLPLGIVWGMAFAGASVDRMGVPLLAVAFIVSVAVITSRMSFRGWKTLLGIALATGLAAIAFAALIWLVDASRNTYTLRLLFSSGWRPVPQAATWEFFWRFTSFVHQSWWSSLGWVRYAPPPWWVSTTMIVTTMATTGIAWRIFGGRLDDRPTRMLLSVAAMSVAIQLAAIYWTYFRLGNGAQGKSLFPVLVPGLILLWAGIAAWVPETRRAHAAVALVAGLAFLDAAVWGLVAIPAYYASL
jgi:hypothetical protein